jgi:hypothetical protein
MARMMACDHTKLKDNSAQSDVTTQIWLSARCNCATNGLYDEGSSVLKRENRPVNIGIDGNSGRAGLTHIKNTIESVAPEGS